MADDQTAWQDAALNQNDLIGPQRPADLPVDNAPDYDALPEGGDEYDELESGIASIFAAMQAAVDDDAGAGDTGSNGGDEPFAEAHTYALLGELDRLWQRPSP